MILKNIKIKKIIYIYHLSLLAFEETFWR